MMAMVANVILITDLGERRQGTRWATSLLASGAIIWLGERPDLRTALLGAGQRRATPPLPAEPRAGIPFAFSQQLNPELAPEGSRPGYVDYLILGITTSTAFSPTDVMPMAPWAKLMMAVQSLVSLTVIGLVIARAVNTFT